MKTNLVHSVATRQARGAAKRRALLRWLRDFGVTSVPHVMYLWGMASRSSCLKGLRAMEREELVSLETLTALGRSSLLVSLTPHGLALSFDEGEPFEDRPTVNVSTVSLFTLQHRWDVQTARLQAEAAGWLGWVTEGRFSVSSSNDYRPDGLVVRPDGARVALELERSIKSKKRYATGPDPLIRRHLLHILDQRYDLVHYVSPTPELAARLSRLFDSVATVKDSRRQPHAFAGTARRARFEFHHLAAWPPPSSSDLGRSVNE